MPCDGIILALKIYAWIIIAITIAALLKGMHAVFELGNKTFFRMLIYCVSQMR